MLSAYCRFLGCASCRKGQDAVNLSEWMTGVLVYTRHALTHLSKAVSLLIEVQQYSTVII